MKAVFSRKERGKGVVNIPDGVVMGDFPAHLLH